MGDVVSLRSDAIPGIYRCVECGVKFGSLMEAWRAAGNPVPNTAVLFCEPCAMRLRQSMNLNLEPIQLSNLDKLNLGQFVPEVGVVQLPQPQAAAPMKPTAADLWKDKINS